MPRPIFTVTVKDTPTYAPPNFGELDSLIPLGKVFGPLNGRWHGSGVRVQMLPSYTHYYDNCQYCGYCRAEALCIYVSHWENHVGKAVTLELFCKECMKFTVYDWTA
ncbi:MAG: hypothetical protein ACFFCO_06055 [Promethearchaeota archaeon]